MAELKPTMPEFKSILDKKVEEWRFKAMAARERLSYSVANAYHECADFLQNAARTLSAEGSRFTYSSEQATKCAVCGEHKHTPLRNDTMGGYVCLTCIDKELERLQTDRTIY